MPAGYSQTPLVRKLGIKPGHRVRFIDAPEDYLTKTLGPLPDDVTVAASLRGTLDVIQVFAPSESVLREKLPGAMKAMATDGAIWISWPKKASGVSTDLTGDIVRRIGLAAGLVDIKVCAVDEIWSGLKFVIPVAKR